MPLAYKEVFHGQNTISLHVLIKWITTIPLSSYPLQVILARVGVNIKQARRIRGSRKQKRKNKPIIGPENEPCDWFILSLLLTTPTILFSLDRKRRSHKRNRKKTETFCFLRLRFRRPYDSTYDSVVWFSIDRKYSYDSDYDSDSVASEKQPLKNVTSLCTRKKSSKKKIRSRRTFVCKHEQVRDWDTFLLVRFLVQKLFCQINETHGQEFREEYVYACVKNPHHFYAP